MQILKELLKLNDPLGLNEAEVPVELKAIIDAFPHQHGKAIAKLWGGKRIVWHGKRFFEDGDLGAAYKGAEQAAEEYINDGYNTDVNMEIDASAVPDITEAGDIDFRFDAEFGKQHGGDWQECYLGYDPKKDKLYIGFDAWTDEENFNNDFDSAFKEATGLEFDMDDPEHSKVFHKAWEDYKNDGYSFWGLIFEITDNHGEFSAEEAMTPMTHGFYKGTYKLFKQQHPNVVDLRLD